MTDQSDKRETIANDAYHCPTGIDRDLGPLIAAAPDLLRSTMDMSEILRAVQDILSDYLDPGERLNNPKETIGEILKITDGRDTLNTQRKADSAIQKAYGEPE